MTRTIIVIPCYNEAERLDIKRFVEYSLDDPPCSFLFVNDGSTDNTLDLLHDLQQYDSQQFRVLSLEKNCGKAEAVRQGILAALDDSPQFVGYWDADLATPLEAIDQFSEFLKQHPSRHVVFGARVRLLGRAIQRKPLRHYLGRLFAALASWVLGVELYDTQCGAKLFRVTATTRNLFERPFISNWIFDVELIARMIQQQRCLQTAEVEQIIYELPLYEWRDVAGSKLRPRDFLTAFKELVGIYRKYLSPTAMKQSTGLMQGQVDIGSETEADNSDCSVGKVSELVRK